jgi:hypothetical protein
MAETKKTTITVDDVDYVYEDMTPQQQAMVNHISDLDRKIGTSQFNLDQLNVGKDAFVKMLKAALEPKEE